MIQVIDGEIKQLALPKTGTLKDGSTVSAYYLLDEATLADEGWLPLEDEVVTYNEQTEYLIKDGYTILEDKVIQNYKVGLLIDRPKFPNPYKTLAILLGVEE